MRTASDSAKRSSSVGTSTCGGPRSSHCATPASTASSGSISARPATRVTSSRIAATQASPAARERSRMSPEDVRQRYARVREEVGAGVTIVAATKYVSLADMAILAEAGIEVVGENRAQDLEAKHAEYGDTFRWHFIGHLQSNKAKVVSQICELVHSLDSASTAKRLTTPALVEVNLSGEGTKSGVAPDDLPGFLTRYGDVRGLMTMPPE